MKCPYSIIDLTLPNVDTPRLRSLGEIIKLASDCIDRIRCRYGKLAMVSHDFDLGFLRIYSQS